MSIINLNRGRVFTTINLTRDYEAESLAIFAAMGTTPSYIQAQNINDVVKSLKDEGLWAIGDVLVVLGSVYADGSLINWFNPGTYDGILQGTPNPTFQTLMGYTSDGANGYIKTGYTLDGNGNYKQNDASFGVYIMTNAGENIADIGRNATHDTYLRTRQVANNIAARINSQTNLNATPITDSRGITIISRTGANDVAIYKNGNWAFSSAATASTGLPGAECYVLTDDAISFSTKQCAAYFILSGLSLANARKLSDILNQYFRNLGTNVYDYGADVILVGDKTSSHSIADSLACDNAILANYPEEIVGCGDYANAGSSIEEIMQYYVGQSAVKKIHSCFGNHDEDNDPTGQQFLDFFNTTKSYYSKVIGDAEFFFYDVYLKEDESGWYSEAATQLRTQASFEDSDQGKWLVAAMANSQATWKILAYHQPTWGSRLALNWTPGMAWDWYSYGVDVILNAHFHFYERLLINTGTGNVPVINIGTSGCTQFGWGAVAAGSLVRLRDAVDADFSSGMYLTLNISSTQLSFNLHAVSGVNDVAGKDTLILNK